MTLDRSDAGKSGLTRVWRPSGLSLAAALALQLSSQVVSSNVALAQTALPATVKPTCTVTGPEFNGWFDSGSVSPNGEVLPADSFAFTPNSLCSFYKWSEQMFLWLNSPVPARWHRQSRLRLAGLLFGFAGGREQQPDADSPHPGSAADFPAIHLPARQQGTGGGVRQRRQDP